MNPASSSAAEKRSGHLEARHSAGHRHVSTVSCAILRTEDSEVEQLQQRHLPWVDRHLEERAGPIGIDSDDAVGLKEDRDLLLGAIARSATAAMPILVRNVCGFAGAPGRTSRTRSLRKKVERSKASPAREIALVVGLDTVWSPLANWMMNGRVGTPLSGIFRK